MSILEEIRQKEKGDTCVESNIYTEVVIGIRMIWFAESAMGADMPTREQLETYFVLTARLTKMYVSVNLGTVDERTQNLYVLAGEEIEIVIYPDGEWIFV